VEQKDSCENSVVIELDIVPHGTQATSNRLIRKDLRHTLFHVEQSQPVCARLTPASSPASYEIPSGIRSRSPIIPRGTRSILLVRERRMFHVEPATDSKPPLSFAMTWRIWVGIQTTPWYNSL